jgi:hypothetical protein
MPPLAEYFPWYAWLTVLTLAAVAAVPFFLSTTLRAGIGLSLLEYLAVLAVVEFGAAAGIGALVVYYRNNGERDADDDDEWRFDP